MTSREDLSAKREDYKDPEQQRTLERWNQILDSDEPIDLNIPLMPERPYSEVRGIPPTLSELRALFADFRKEIVSDILNALEEKEKARQEAAKKAIDAIRERPTSRE